METSTLMETPNKYMLEEYKNSFMDEDGRIEFPIILSTVIVLSLIGNILVVVISVLCMRLRSLTSILILNLALSDLLFTVALVFRVCEHFWGLTLGDAACKAVYFIFTAGFYSSIVFLVLMSVQRHMAVTHPHTGCKKGRCITCILFCVWIVSIWAALLNSLYSTILPYSGSCTYSSKSAFINITYKENIVYVCTFLFMCFCYIRILRTIFKSPPNKKNRTTGLVFLLVATFFVSWTPYNIVKFLDTFSHFQVAFSSLRHLSYASYICHLLACTRCCLNPVIYGLFAVKFRKGIFQRRATSNSEQIRMEEFHSNRSVSA